jgi:hypothetical protein
MQVYGQLGVCSESICRFIFAQRVRKESTRWRRSDEEKERLATPVHRRLPCRLPLVTPPGWAHVRASPSVHTMIHCHVLAPSLVSRPSRPPLRRCLSSCRHARRSPLPSSLRSTTLYPSRALRTSPPRPTLATPASNPGIDFLFRVELDLDLLQVRPPGPCLRPRTRLPARLALLLRRGRRRLLLCACRPEPSLHSPPFCSSTSRAPTA